MPRIYKKSSDVTSGWVGFLKAPTQGSGRATFTIVERKNVGGKSTNRTVKSEALNAINHQFKEKKLNLEQARTLAKDVLAQLYPKHAILFNQSNLNLLKQYWDQEYQHRDLVDRRSAWNRLSRAVEAAGSYSLLSAGREELQKQINDYCKTPNQQRGVVAPLNQILHFFKRDFRLRKMREEIKPVRYVTVDEFKRMLPHFQDERIRLLHEVALATGMRLGEIFAAQTHHLKQVKKGWFLFVDSQLDGKNRLRPTKTRTKRNAFIIPQFLESVKAWLSIPLEQRMSFRQTVNCKITNRISNKALGKSLVFHDLRHSYAVINVSKQVPLTFVAQSLGNSIRVAERYYSGFILTNDSIEAMAGYFA